MSLWRSWCSAGGVGSSWELEEFDFTIAVTQTLKCKVNYKRCYQELPTSNLAMATF